MQLGTCFGVGSQSLWWIIASVHHGAGRPVDFVAGHWDAPPQHLPTTKVPDGPLLGNGQLGAGITWDLPQASVAFHLGHNSFFVAPTSGLSSCGYGAGGHGRGGRKALGGLELAFHVDAAAAAAAQWPANASAAVRFETPAGPILVTSFVHAQEDALLMEVSSARELHATATVWTYSGCDGPPRPPVAYEARAEDGKRIFRGTSPTLNRLPASLAAGSDGIQVMRASGWPFQSEHFDVQWFSLLGRSMHGFTDVAVLGSCGERRGPCARGSFRVPGGRPHALTLELLRWGLREAPAPAPPWRAPAHLWHGHVQFWDRFWEESFVELPGSPATEFHWYMSQYLLGAASRGEASPGLFGPFVFDDEVAWSGDITLNYNAEATYYAAASSNHLAVFEPYFRSILEYLPQARHLASVRAPGCAGALHYPGHILPRGTTSGSGGDMGQKQTGLFAAVPFLLFWRFTRDLDFAARALPFLRGVAAFWQCSLVLGDDGRLHDAEDCAEELCLPDGDLQPDPAVVLSLLPSFFAALADMAEALGAEPEARAQWRAAAGRIAAYPTEAAEEGEVIADFRGGEGAQGLALRLHEGGSVGWGGLFAAFPLGSIGPASPAAERELLGRSLDRFFRLWPGGKQGNSFVHAFPAAARAGWRPHWLHATWEAYLLNTSDPKCRMHPNGMVLGCGGTGLENVGGTAYVNEMLLQSHSGILRLFPTLPAGVPARFLLRAVGGFLVSASRPDGWEVGAVTITAPGSRGGRASVPAECAVQDPWGLGGALVDGAPHAADASGVLRFRVREGGAHALRPWAPEGRGPAGRAG